MYFSATVEKSQILTIGNTEVTPNFKLGDETIDPTTTYKYLGMTVNRKGNLEAHLNAVKGKVEAALQTIFCTAGNEEFRIVEMANFLFFFGFFVALFLDSQAACWPC